MNKELAEPEVVQPEVIRRPSDITTLQEMGLSLSEAYIDTVMGNTKLLTEKFKNWLDAEVDYTTKLFPGQKKPSLLDTGASKFFTFFRCWPKHRIVERLVETKGGEERIRVIVAAQLVSSLYGFIVGEGVGSCSTDEKKYKYRWIQEQDLREVYGWGDDDFSGVKSDKRGGGTYYYVRNPEILDLENTIVKMAAKRSEVDAALQLPGVGAVFTQDMGERLKEASKTEQQAREAEIKAQAKRDKEELDLKKQQQQLKPDPKTDPNPKTDPSPNPKTDPKTEMLIKRPEPPQIIGPDWMKGTLEQLGINTNNLDFEAHGQDVIIIRKGFLTEEVFNKIGEVVKQLGGEWRKEGAQSHWQLPA